MTDDRPLFIVNPASGGGRTKKRWPLLAKAIEEAGLAPEAVHTEAVGHGIQLAAEALARGRRKLIAVGGDGTVNELVTAVLAAGAGTDVQLGTIGMGTGKGIVKCLRIGGPHKAIEAIAAGHDRRIDAGRVISRNETGDPMVRFFVLMAAAGWVPEISIGTRPFLKRFGDTVPYLLTLLVKLAGPTGRPFEVTIDGVAHDDRYNTISVHNMPLWGGDLTAAPGAKPDDGLFDIIRWGDSRRFTILKAVQGQKRGGTHLAMDGIHHHLGRTVEIGSEKRTLVDLDGERAGFVPARVTMLEGALRFLVPQSSLPDSAH